MSGRIPAGSGAVVLAMGAPGSSPVRRHAVEVEVSRLDHWTNALPFLSEFGPSDPNGREWVS